MTFPQEEQWLNHVRRPDDRRRELMQLAANISAKHEGGDVHVERIVAYPSDILDYFREKRR